ncbi:MAG: CBS domain-containing protein [Methylococcales bacterium]|jgi:CBS domain-containing protein|nr:CBS domain-containing protein [Methylococcales bacterium]
MDTPIRSLIDEKPADLLTVSEDTTVTEAVKIMNDKNIGAVMITKNGALTGIFTERDVLRRILAKNLHADETKMSEVMTTKLLTIKPSNTIKDILVIITEKKIRHLPVLEDNKLISIISAGDVSRYLVKDQQHLIAELENYISGSY